MHKILVPLDGSARAAAVVPAAASLARVLGSELLLLQVVGPERLSGSHEGEAPGGAVAQAEAQAYLEQVAAEIRESGVTVIVTTDFGYPTTRIVETVRHDPFISKIVLAPHGAGEALEQVFGHTVEEVLSTAGVPVVLVREGQTLPPLTVGSTILVPFDNSPLAHQALDEAEAIAARVGATLLIATVVPPLDYLTEQGLAPTWYIETEQLAANRTRRELEQIARRIAATGLPVQIEQVEGQPAEEIINLAATWGAALIVMAPYGESALHWGRVALAVLRQTPVPIVLPAGPCSYRHALDDTPSRTMAALRWADL